MKVLIVEDDIIQSENLKQMLQDMDKTLEIFIAEDKSNALTIAGAQIIDAFYIDIFLKNSSGLDLAIDLRKIHNYELSWIIFLTTHIEYITQAFKEAHCYDYILKPYDKKALVAISKLILSHSSTNSVIKRKYVIFDLKDSIFIKIYVDEIIFIEVNFRTCTLYTINSKYEIKGLSLKKSLKLINSKDIIQCHKSFAVNINYIIKIKLLNIKSYEIFFENYEKTVLLSYKCKNIIMENFKNNKFNIL